MSLPVLSGPARQLQRVMATHLAAQDRDAVLYWLRHSGVGREERVRMATRLMVGSLYAQAGLHGLVRCSRCGDTGCDWCGQ